MHELSIIEAMIERVRREVERLGRHGRVLQVELVIGRFSGVHCDSIRFALELLAPGTLIDGAQVHITERPATCRCEACDARTEIDDLVSECPQCNSRKVSIEGGRELLLQSIEVEE